MPAADKMASENPTVEVTGSKELDKIVEKAVMTISTCVETDPRVKISLDSLQGAERFRFQCPKQR
jgi:hypothetical protein